MIRVLRILNRFNLGGPTYNAAYLTRYLPEPFETLLVGGKNDPTEKNSEFIPHQLGISPVIIEQMRRSLSPAQDREAYREIKKIIREYRPHIVHTHASKAGAVGRLAARAEKVPVVVHTFHGHVFDAYFSHLKAGFYKNIERYLARISTGIIAISDIQKYDLSHKYRICPEEKIKVIPLGFDLSHFREDPEGKRKAFREKYQLAEDEIAIGIVGRLVPIKNHELFLEALHYLSQRSQSNIRAFIIGDGESRHHLEAKARHLKLDFVDWKEEQRPALLTFAGWLTEMDQVNAGMDIIALCSLNEGTPVSLIEAQAAGKPIVSTNVGGIENIVLPGQTALLIKNCNPEEFAEQLRMLAENESLRKAMGRGSWEMVYQKFHYQRLIDDMAEYYNSLLTAKGIKFQ
ncbi:MAG: glycosyltransferase [Bacteroidales bacterium]|jgi:glycosyltransferase involved in cell wall biosynthesis|nr:glycosyltransferase [Bacteroidales bacterium]